MERPHGGKFHNPTLNTFLARSMALIGDLDDLPRPAAAEPTQTPRGV
jgi:hypothetical protein